MGQLTVVDLGPGEFELGVSRFRRNVPYPKIGQALFDDFVYRAKYHTRAVSVYQVAVDPGLSRLRQLIVGNFAHGERHLPVVVAQLVAVDIHIGELIVEPYLL